MADPELVRVVDYILNRCDDAAIEAVSAAVVRRRRELALFGGASKLPDPKRLAKELSSQINVAGNIDVLKQSILEYAVRIIKQEAPELNDDQIAELTRAWIPGSQGGSNGSLGSLGENSPGEQRLPADLLASMIDQFISFSLGRMDGGEDRKLRKEIGAWPDRYWKAFPRVIRLIITDFLKGEMTEGEFNARIGTALSM